MVRAGLLVARSISTSFGPSLTTAAIAGAAGSSTQRLPFGPATTLCTQTQWLRASTSSFFALRHAFHSESGNGVRVPSFSSATETALSSVQRGKFTKTRPSLATVTPVT